MGDRSADEGFRFAPHPRYVLSPSGLFEERHIDPRYLNSHESGFATENESRVIELPGSTHTQDLHRHNPSDPFNPRSMISTASVFDAAFCQPHPRSFAANTHPQEDGGHHHHSLPRPNAARLLFVFHDTDASPIAPGYCIS